MLGSAAESILRRRGEVARAWTWLALAVATLLWPSVVAQAGIVARHAGTPARVMALRLFAVFLAFALLLRRARQ